VGFPLRQFSGVFKIRNAAGQPYVLIGGQAVNYWAERYLPVEPELQKLRPFTSEDIDFKGSQEDVQRNARQLALSPSYPSKAAMTALSGLIPFPIGNVKSAIELVRRVPGISDWWRLRPSKRNGKETPSGFAIRFPCSRANCNWPQRCPRRSGATWRI
jgi:hypothetical protein